ncbi:unnamed protein product [Didymodactylos carnosus]|uniref:Uncharacterized protein n=1 Tax=Didymodactylos carnosus TaxID=1234261 RepID=A0A815LPR6_9BILA|nr:unnamed protein product [Didymodactylos carnosus]CAF4300714.1 unnamed protein product [Didymodactylos carnosus]
MVARLATSIEELCLNNCGLRNVLQFYFRLFNSFQQTKLRRLFITNIAKSTTSSSPIANTVESVKDYFQETTSLELLQMQIYPNGKMSFAMERCDGLQSNLHIEKLDLRLNGNNLETFIHEYTAQLAGIPRLVALDLTNYDKRNVNLIGFCTLDIEYSQFQKNVSACAGLITCQPNWPYEKLTEVTADDLNESVYMLRNSAATSPHHSITISSRQQDAQSHGDLVVDTYGSFVATGD